MHSSTLSMAVTRRMAQYRRSCLSADVEHCQAGTSACGWRLGTDTSLDTLRLETLVSNLSFDVRLLEYV